MGCIYLEDDETCSIYNPGVENPGCDEDGICNCYDDPDPSDLCESYESNE